MAAMVVGDEVDATLRPVGEQPIVVVGPVHGHELGPAGETLGRLFRSVFPHQLLELPPWHLLQKLTEETRMPYHDVEALLMW